jgi:hypothetical protein
MKARTSAWKVDAAMDIYHLLDNRPQKTIVTAFIDDEVSRRSMGFLVIR